MAQPGGEIRSSSALRRRVAPGNANRLHRNEDISLSKGDRYGLNGYQMSDNRQQYDQEHDVGNTTTFNSSISDAHAAARVIQKAVRRQLVSTYWTFLLQYFVSWTISIQAIHRGRRARFSFNLLRDLASKSQALVRGWLVRRVMHTIRKDRLTAYRAQVFELWRRSYTPLSYRVRFWTYINRYRFLHLALHEEELLKLWEALGLKRLNLSRPKHERERLKTATPTQDNRGPRSCHLFVEEHFGYRSQVIQKRFMIIQRKLESVKMEHRQLDLLPVFPTEFALCKDVTVSLSRDDPSNNLATKTDNLREARDRLEQERENMYKALKQCKKTHPGTWTNIFTSMKIPVSVQQKKRKVVKLLWEHPAYAKTSLQVYFMTEGPNKTTGQQGGTGGSGLTTEYSAKILNARRSKWRLDDDLPQRKSIRRLRLERKGINFRLQRRSIVAGMKVTDWMDQRAILIGGFLYERAGDARYDPLAARMMLLRRVNVRRRRNGEQGGASQANKVHRGRPQQSATSSTQLSLATVNTPTSVLGPQVVPPSNNGHRHHADDSSVGEDSSSHASRSSSRSRKIRNYLSPKKGKNFGIRRSKSTSIESESNSANGIRRSKSTSIESESNSANPLRAQSIKHVEPARRISNNSDHSEQAPLSPRFGIKTYSHYHDAGSIKECEEESVPRQNSSVRKMSRSGNKESDNHLDKLEKELLDAYVG
jgi:hypothetical protein